jgi:hypothetical protein
MICESLASSCVRIIDRHHAVARVRPVEVEQRLRARNHGRQFAPVERTPQRRHRLLAIRQRLELLPLLPLPPTRLAASLAATLRQLTHPRSPLRFALGSVALLVTVRFGENKGNRRSGRPHAVLAPAE